ncbi:MAG: cell envelope integrity protein CreD [Lentisphaeria bacterium]|nr:cell envelope integrity protein CreD [Lentisphaeria bacterium]
MNEPQPLHLEIQRRIRTSMTAKIVMIALVVLLCQIPVLMVDGLISRRQNLARSVEQEIASKWGYRQKISGPILAIPLFRQNKMGEIERSTFFAVPQNLRITGTLYPEMRYRGIYEIVLYRSRIKLTGDIVFRDPGSQWQASPEKSRLIIGISDLQGLSAISGKYNDTVLTPVTGLCDDAPFLQGFSLPLNTRQNGTFEINFDLNGCRELLFTMVGRQTELSLESTWPTPSFRGAFLPTQRNVTADGFTATWSVSEFNRDLAATWTGDSTAINQRFEFENDQRPYDCSAGVMLLQAADTYLQTNRAVEYAILVFIIVLMAMLIAEKITGVWVHPLQYFITALSLVLFYTLTLAISEHTSFGTAYLISAAALTGMSIFYSALIYRRPTAAICMGSATAIAYAAIYVILQLEDYALLTGSILLFILLTVLMYFTGKINRLPAETGSTDCPAPPAN